MEGQAFFTTVAGLGVSLAGFGSVIAWLREDPAGWDPVNLWRLKTIVRHALTLTFVCLAFVPIHTFTGSDETTVRIGSAAAAAFALSDMWRVRRPDPHVRDTVSWWTFVSASVVIASLGILNLFWASLGLLEAVILVLLTSPAGIFSNFVRELGPRRESPDSGELPPASL